MDGAMLILVAVGLLAGFANLAITFGAESRDGFSDVGGSTPGSATDRPRRPP